MKELSLLQMQKKVEHLESTLARVQVYQEEKTFRFEDRINKISQKLCSWQKFFVIGFLVTNSATLIAIFGFAVSPFSPKTATQIASFQDSLPQPIQEIVKCR